MSNITNYTAPSTVAKFMCWALVVATLDDLKNKSGYTSDGIHWELVCREGIVATSARNNWLSDHVLNSVSCGRSQ